MTTWTDDLKLIGQANTTYNDPTITYNQATETYSGQLATTWSNDSRN